jgi:nucleotide-binding universal stress UspA family protein
MSVFPTKILLATDGSEDTRRATEAATDLASRSRSKLHVVHVWQDVPGFAHAFVKRELRRQGQEILDQEVKKIEDAGGTVTQAHLRAGRTSDEIVELGDELGVGLLVVGSRGLGMVQRIVMGSHSEEIVHHARGPVLVVRRGESIWPPTRIVIGEDFSDDARKAGEIAASIGALYGSQVLLIYARPDRSETSEEPGDVQEEDEDKLKSRADELGEILGSRPEIMVSDDRPAAVLLRTAERESRPPLIAVGSRGIAGIRRTRLGSVSTKIVTAAPGLVLVCPHVEQG